MSKTKMRCITCGKWFQSANAREVTCPDCTLKARKEKMAAKSAPSPATQTSGTPIQSSSQRTAVPPPPKPKAEKGGTNQWLDSLSDVKVGQPESPPQRPKLPSSPPHQGQHDHQPNHNGPGGYRNTPTPQGPGNYRSSGPSRGPGAYHVSNGAGLSPSLGQRPPAPRHPQDPQQGQRQGPPGVGSYERERRGGPAGRGGPKPWQAKGAAGTPKPKNKVVKSNRPAPKPKREKVPPPEPFTPTEEQVKQIEERYLVLSQPAEFDGIRSQIAEELKIPKRAVKKIIKELRDRQHIPSWWELQTYKGSTEELEKIKEVYQPYLPVPPVGVHKLISDKLNMKPGEVYQAIKSIRYEMQLPQYNNPDLHEEELAEARRQRLLKQQQKASAQQTETSDTAAETPETPTAAESHTAQQAL